MKCNLIQLANLTIAHACASHCAERSNTISQTQLPVRKLFCSIRDNPEVIVPKSTPSQGGYGPPILRFVGPTRVYNQNWCMISSSDFCIAHSCAQQTHGPCYECIYASSVGNAAYKLKEASYRSTGPRCTVRMCQRVQRLQYFQTSCCWLSWLVDWTTTLLADDTDRQTTTPSTVAVHRCCC